MENAVRAKVTQLGKCLGAHVAGNSQNHEDMNDAANQQHREQPEQKPWKFGPDAPRYAAQEMGQARRSGEGAAHEQDTSVIAGMVSPAREEPVVMGAS